MSSSRRVSGRLILAAIALTIPSTIFALVQTAAKADECALVTSTSATTLPLTPTIKCN